MSRRILQRLGCWVGQAALLTVGSTALSLVVNAVRADGLPLVASKPYEIYTDCPELITEAAALDSADLEAVVGEVQVIDARAAADFRAGHPLGALSLPYSALTPPDDAALGPLREFGPGRILVVGDTALDSGRLLAADLATAGLQGVRFLEGGFPAWVATGQPVDGDLP